MEINDKVYGKYKVKEKILVDLINTKAIQRLKGIRQQGLPPEWHYGVEYSRYDHSIGVMILLDKLGANLKEKIAGLLHDISHTAFSHVYDYYVKNKGESTQDNLYKKYLSKDKQIKRIVEKYNYSIFDFKNLEKYLLLENDAPDLCVDRIDYTLREYVAWKKNDKKISVILTNLIVKDNEIIFKTKKAAKYFYEIYKYFAENHWGGKGNHTIDFNVFAKILDSAINLKLITKDDFKKTDDYILTKIKKSKHPTIMINIQKLITKKYTTKDKQNLFYGKKRFVNPRYILKGKVLYLLDNIK